MNKWQRKENQNVTDPARENGQTADAADAAKHERRGKVEKRTKPDFPEWNRPPFPIPGYSFLSNYFSRFAAIF